MPGRWEGDLIFGKATRSVIGTLVERSTRFVILLHLPDGHGAPQVRDRMLDVIQTLPTELHRPLTFARREETARAEIGLVAVAAQLNERPRKTLGWLNPTESLNRLLSGESPVATTG